MVNYRRGLNRLFVALWVIWGLLILVGWPLWYISEARKDYGNMSVLLMLSKPSPEEKAKNEKLLNEMWERASFAYT